MIHTNARPASEDFAIKMTKVTAGSWRKSSSGYVYWIALVVVTIVVLVAFVRCQDVFTAYFPLQGSNLKPGSNGKLASSSSKLHVEPPVQKLINSIRQATETARTSSGSRFSFSAEEKGIWKEHNTCRSRQELLPMYAQLKRVVSNPQWDLVLQEYAILHRTCTQAAGNLTEYLMSRNESTGCKFLFSGARSGLGNRVTHELSSFLYAVLTQRVFIVPTAGHLPDIMCEPFEGSTWRIISDMEPFPGVYKSIHDAMGALDREKSDPAASERFYALRVELDWTPVKRFFCDTEQEYLSRVPLLGCYGPLYWMPKLFAIPSFRPVLEALFPDPSLAMTTILRSLMLPGDLVWERFKSVRRAYLDNGDTQVGFQLRFFHDDKYEELNPIVNANIMNCSLLHGFLPDITTNSTIRMADDSKPKVIRVFIASLFMGLRNFLNNKYLRHLTVTEDSVSIVQLTEELHQETTLEVDFQALVEILSLSFSDTLFVTGVSTFGALAQSYGAVIPWYVSLDNDPTKPSCTRGQTVDTCYQEADELYVCPYEPELNEKQISDVVPYFQSCLSVDARGVQLVNISNHTLAAPR